MARHHATGEITTTASKPHTDIEEMSLSPQMVLGLRRRVAVSDLASFFAEAMPAVAAGLKRQGIPPAGPPIAMYSREQGDTFEVTVGFPVTRLPVTTNSSRCSFPVAGRSRRR